MLAVIMATRSTFSRRTRLGPRSKDRQLLEPVAILPQLFRKPDDHPRHHTVFDDLAGDRALEQRLDRLRELGRAQTVPGEGRAVRVDQELRHARLFLVVEIDDAVDFRQDAFDLRRQTTQHRQVRAEDLDREVRPAARDHVIDPVADRLAEADRNPGDRGDRAPHLGQKLLLPPA
jgi:hypothetical protein